MINQTHFVFTCTNFAGYYPVGTALVVVARNHLQAKALVLARLYNEHIPQSPYWEPELNVLPLDAPSTRILCNGNY